MSRRYIENPNITKGDICHEIYLFFMDMEREGCPASYRVLAYDKYDLRFLKFGKML